ncbi:protein GRAVITROPIC IN THE LIGHT 1-like isoform X1 [Benincasa hispida]|uniref:protein GRAVITROPIC IN THE LIGHT 1-like isoform X1 n=2 Tax=Benincasa hispida TaxID=102211 RepID=UPI0019007E29|nr:protein GRAVITROPIC IN THE LIGHT 1-like isoform X1 [Benincasa hispida]XP_038896245.1 protein GRAVITROPIC IN THE LIGHT 1-like isoform X1 [Benincasa hispida]
MDSVKQSAVSSKKSKLARTFAKVLHIRMLTGVSAVDGVEKGKRRTVVKNNNGAADSESDSFDCSDEDQQERGAMEAFLAKVFANITALKAAYAQLQYAQCPFDVDGIQVADRSIVSELKSLSELKRCFVKKQFDLLLPETAMLSAELVEQKSVVKMYEISVKKLNSQVRLKESEIIFLKEKLEEAKSNNKVLEKRMNQSGPLQNLHLSAINSNHLARVLRHTVKTVRSFVQLLIDEMKCGGWDIDEAASTIEPDIVYFKEEHKCFAFEAFVCRVMFEGFHFPNFALPNESLPPDKKQQTKLYLRRFAETKSLKSKQLLGHGHEPNSTFAKFCRVKYLQLIHPKMESSFFGNLSQRSLVSSGKIPETAFFARFADMARWVWLLHCLAFSFEPEASIFRVNNGCRFNDVYMKGVTEEVFILSTQPDLRVAFTVVPGFYIGKTVIQSLVYLSQQQQTSC